MTTSSQPRIRIDNTTFLASGRSQLDDPDARNACIQSTGLAGHHGVLFKIRSPNSGHCLVAKGFVAGNAHLAHHEAAVYTRLQELQAIASAAGRAR
ncbi:hypothetical protein OC861_005917 [Tilletia horrida]|nr:hypothetical protein OC861_005917 [Tilletia horrida]